MDFPLKVMPSGSTRHRDTTSHKISRHLYYQEKQQHIEDVHKQNRDNAKLAKRNLELETKNDEQQNQIMTYESEVQKLQQQIRDLEAAKEEALTRLSKAAGAKLTVGNAAITDLSDEHRPTKLAEKFSELYDNIWTDTFEEISIKIIDDRDIISALLHILKEAFDYCAQLSQKYREEVRRSVLSVPETGEEVMLDPSTEKLLTDLRYALSGRCAVVVEKGFAKIIAGSQSLKKVTILEGLQLQSMPKTLNYIKQCANICWLMCVRDPPLRLDFSAVKGQKFDSDLFRQYTKSGIVIEYIVWPVLYLHENGPLLAKGVAQPE